ncbi:phosphoglycerate kinase [Haloactinomyces albus]|uniref:Phosphoglycerate kinase n=1 Tax=Haloactinomyces albus TaxID=1352928 RepID=A0AAE4CKM0_9ACTN|nr:phosphoglycerate kinase [Haloactinomyces albus]MDR7301240.1 phosphoglycerate kinase [Haloactinomyces albus]
MDPELISTARIDSELADLERLVESGARVAVLSHQGSHRDGSATSLEHVTEHLARRLNRPVRYFPENASDEAVRVSRNMHPGDIVVFGNTRHHAGEEQGDAALAYRFAQLGDQVAVGGFSKAHRAHASNTGLLEHLPGFAAGSLVTEARFLSSWAGERPDTCSAAILGGRKPEKTLIGLVHFAETCDLVIPAGVVLNTVLRALGHDVADSDLGTKPAACLDAAREVLASGNARLHVPRTVWAAPDDGTTPRAAHPVAIEDGVPDGHAIVDFALEPWAAELLGKTGRTVLAGTPTRYLDGHREASDAILASLEPVAGTTLLLGGDTVAELPWSGPVATGGGSALELLATGTCAVLDALRNNTRLAVSNLPHDVPGEVNT